MSWTIKDVESGRTWEKSSRKEAEDAIEDFGDQFRELKLIGPNGETDGGEAPPVTEEPVVKEVLEEDQKDFGDELAEITEFQQDPIGYLESINKEFVNTIKGTPAISKRGFRFMQTELGVSTSAELVTTFDDPKGVVIHARAEMPDGRYAEAHGEGYKSESGVSDNEFVRYADTRAKNRAISDLTSSGALAESELSE